VMALAGSDGYRRPAWAGRGQKMRIRLIQSIGASVLVVAAVGVLRPPTAANESASAPPKTAWGEPDIQGIWTDESDTPLQRPAKYANQEFFTPEQRAELDQERAQLLRRDRRVERGTELDVAGAYNAVFMSMKRTGARTSMIV